MIHISSNKVWDIGDDEEIERLIDKAIRILLIHPEFEKFLWKNRKTLIKIYDDETFGEVVSQIHKIIMEITREMALEKMEHTSALKSLAKNVNLSNLKGVFKHVAGKSDLNEIEVDSPLNEDDEQKLQNMSDEEWTKYAQQKDGDKQDKDKAQKYAFWNITVYNELKKCFGINDKARESYLWSFLLSIACCIV